jgi:glycosyltransferase involved in cell wall biosynthesis
MRKRITFTTNICAHYTIKLFELLSKKYKVKFCFTGAAKNYFDAKSELRTENFDCCYFKGFYIFPKFKIIFGLFRLLFERQDIFIKTIDGRFDLPLIFLFAKILKKPFILWTGIWTHPDTFFHKLSYVFTKFIYRHSDAIVAYGEHVKQYLRGLGVDEEKIFFAPHSIDNTLFDMSSSEDEKFRLRKELSLKNDKIILYVGRMEECKGIKYLIEAISMIKDVPVTFVLIGGGAKKNILEEQCKSSAINYRYLDYVSNAQLYKYFSIAEVFVLPSITTKEFKEPWGLVVNEAMNQACPVITTDAVGAAAGGLVRDGKSGFIVPEKNSAVLKNAIEILLKNPELRKRMGRFSREIVKNWTPEEMLKGFSQAINYACRKYDMSY